MGDRNDASDRAPGVSANDNGPIDSRQELDRVAFAIARLIGRRMARDYVAARLAANNNHPLPAGSRTGRTGRKGKADKTRVALYARYSSNNQSVSSIEDQFRLCREQRTSMRACWCGTGNASSRTRAPASGCPVPPTRKASGSGSEVPHLKIVDDDLCQAVRARQKKIAAKVGPCQTNKVEGRTQRLHLADRPVSLLSGLLSCGCYGGRMGLIVNSRFGCLNHHRRGTSANNRTIPRQRIEARVLAGLKDRLVSSDSVAEAVRAFAEEGNRLNHERRGQTVADRKALDRIERGIQGMIAAIEDGMYQPSMKARMDDLERQKAEIMERLAQAPANIPDLHPNIATHSRRNVERFTEVLDDPDGDREAAEAIRSLIGGIVLSPGEKLGEVHISLRGELMGTLDLAHVHENQREARFMTAAVARQRFAPPGVLLMILFEINNIRRHHPGTRRSYTKAC